MKFDKVSGFMSKIGASLASVIKIALMSKGVSTPGKVSPNNQLIIMGNGPSLRKTIDLRLDWLISHDLMAVNFAANSPELYKLRPKYYMLADRHFFSSIDRDVNVRKLWEELGKITWEMTLFVPVSFRHLVKPLIMNTPDIKIRYFNLTPIEGFKWLNHIFFSIGLGMPRPRNVLIPAIMEGIRLGYKKIFICGADHSWTKTLDVDNENIVVSIQPHFYEDNDYEHKRVRETYKGLKLHDILGSMTVAFKSYWEIADYAKKRKVEIINATPGSMIDAFPRLTENNL